MNRRTPIVRGLLTRIPVVALLLALTPLAAWTVSAQIAQPQAQLPGALTQLSPCEQVHCIVNPEILHFQPPEGGLPPTEIVTWASGYDLGIFDGGRGGIFVARADGTGQRKLTSNLHRNHEREEHGLNLPDDHPSLSPDGRSIVFTSNRADKHDWDLYAMNVNGTAVRRLTTFGGLDTEPVVSPDGQRIAWATELFGDLDIAVAPLPCCGAQITPSQITRVTTSAAQEIEPAWSPDGARIAFSRVLGPGEKDVFTADADGSGGERRITFASGEDHDATFSPDGAELVLTSERPPFSPPYGNIYRIRLSTGSPVTTGDAIPPADGDLTGDFGNAAGDPNWSADGTKIAFFKSVLPVLGPQRLFVMNADGTGKTYIPGESIVNVHPDLGTAFDRNFNDTYDYLEGPPVGRATLTPRKVRAASVTRLRFSWRHPKAWRKLDSLGLRLTRKGRLAAELTFVLRGRYLRLADPETLVFGRARKLGRGSLETDGLRLDLRRTRFVNVSRKKLRLVLAARFARRLAGQHGRTYRVAVTADDLRGGDQQEALGRLRITPP